jgi:hypothetical protein
LNPWSEWLFNSPHAKGKAQSFDKIHKLINYKWGSNLNTSWAYKRVRENKIKPKQKERKAQSLDRNVIWGGVQLHDYSWDVD